jgi:hypothetical protein
MQATWRTELLKAFARSGDPPESMQTTLSEAELDLRISKTYGGSRGLPFTAWGERYVYFPVVYDGLEWVGYAPRNPCDEKTDHMGSE